MPRGEHKFVGVRVLRAAVIIAKPSEFGAGKMNRNFVRCVSQGPSEMSSLRIVTQKDQGQACHVPDVFQRRVIRQGRSFRSSKQGVIIRSQFRISNTARCYLSTKTREIWSQNDTLGRAMSFGIFA